MFIKVAMISLVLASTQVYAGSDEIDNCQDPGKRHYKSCDSHVGWYLGGEIGMAKTDISQHQLDTFYAKSGLSANSIDVDKSDVSGALFFGYQFSSYFGLEAGYLNLGDRRVDFTGQTADRVAYYDNAEHVYPQSAKGLTISAVFSWPLSDNVKLAGKIGYFDWEGDYITYENELPVGNDKISDQDLFYGLEFDYRLDDNIQLYLGYQRFKLTRDDVDELGLGIRYYFNDSNSDVKAAVSAPLMATVSNDSDNDGVEDIYDRCLNSDVSHQVDIYGCVKMSVERVSFALSVLFANDSSIIPESYFDKIAELAEFIKINGIKEIAIVGHTSVPGSESHNMILSKHRAKAVAQRLKKHHGVTVVILQTVARGESELKDSSNTRLADSANRRVEVAVEARMVKPVIKA